MINQRNIVLLDVLCSSKTLLLCFNVDMAMNMAKRTRFPLKQKDSLGSSVKTIEFPAYESSKE